MAEHTISTAERADLHEIEVSELPANIPGSKLLAADIDTAQLKDDAVTTAKILDDNVTTAKILNDAVTTAKILNDNVTTAKILNDAVITTKILDGNVTAAKILNDNVTTVKILDDNVTSPKLSPEIIQTAEIDIAFVDFRALNSAPVELVAAIPGSVIEFVSAMLILDWATTAYANNGIVGVYQTNSAGTLVGQTTTLASFGAQIADTIVLLRPAAEATPSVAATVYLENVPLVLAQVAGDSINGDSPVRVKISYRVHPTGL